MRSISQLPDDGTCPEANDCDHTLRVRDLGRPSRFGVRPATSTREADCPIHGVVASER